MLLIIWIAYISLHLEKMHIDLSFRFASKPNQTKPDSIHKHKLLMLWGAQKYNQITIEGHKFNITICWEIKSNQTVYKQICF